MFSFDEAARRVGEEVRSGKGVRGTVSARGFYALRKDVLGGHLTAVAVCWRPVLPCPSMFCSSDETRCFSLPGLFFLLLGFGVV